MKHNGIHYEMFGAADAEPLLLIHGSTITGRRDYIDDSSLVDLLAPHYRVILPDCPGHGESDYALYSFSHMAAALADLLRALNTGPAHVIGHSNGGNVALYMAKEQPAHTRSAVLLAANGYIDPHIKNRVPVTMDPDYVAQHDVQWMNEMIQLHDTHLGTGYWRQLLRETIQETITNPDWSAADLARVVTPCFCIQGELDKVNAPGRHAQVLAEWLPDSDLWIPPGIGHSVHYQLPEEFVTRVRAFFDKQRT